MLTLEQIDFARNAFKEWLRLYRKNDAGLSHCDSEDDTPTLADIDHSSLLLRLLEGKNALPKPPPLRWSYPCYELGEGKEVEVHEVSSYVDRIIIDQSADWKVTVDPEKIAALYVLDSAAKQGTILEHGNGDYFLLSERDGKRFLRRI